MPYLRSVLDSFDVITFHFTLVIAIVYNVRRFDLVACLGPIFCLSGVEYRYPNRVSIPKFNTGIWVSVPAGEGIGTPGIDTCHQGIDTPLTLH
ncbi:hypothetical protein GQ457_08G027400 [Hibiscus cannabinus]